MQWDHTGEDEGTALKYTRFDVGYNHLDIASSRKRRVSGFVDAVLVCSVERVMDLVQDLTTGSV